MRVNAGPRGLDDARARLTTGRVDGLWIPKATAGTDLDALAAADTSTAATVALGLLIESATGLLTLDTTARNPAVRRVQLGEVDLRADLAARSGRPPARLGPRSGRGTDRRARARMRVARVMVDTADCNAFHASSLHLRSLGFRGCACIHPDQVTIVAIHNVATAEAFALGEREGLDPAQILDVIQDGAGSSVIFEKRGLLMVRTPVSAATAKLACSSKRST